MRLIKASSIQPAGTKPQSSTPSTAPVRTNVVPSKPFWPGHNAQAAPSTAGSLSSSGHELSSNHNYGIHASRQRQLLIHLPTDYRRGVGICLVNRQGLVFTAKRMDDTEGTWQMPQGGIDPCEDPVEAALRELHEETGIRNARIVAAMDGWLHYDFSTQVRAQMHGPWLRYRGQTQKWFLVQYLGEDDSEIDLGCHGEPEFSEYQWMQLEQLPGRVVSFKQQVYHEVQRHFAPRIQQLVAQQHHWQQGIC